MLLICPVSAVASDMGSAAMISATGKVTVNGNLVTGSMAIFPGSVVETSLSSVANLTVSGSTVMLQPESLVRFDGNEVYLDHGGMTVGTSTTLRAHVKCVTATPATNQWTQYDVVNVGQTVQVVDRKGAVNISTGDPFDLVKASATSATTGQSQPVASLAEGQQYNRHESEGCPNNDRKKRPLGMPPYAPYIIAGGGLGGVIILLLHPSRKPISDRDP